jgi:hypothetical protein
MREFVVILRNAILLCTLLGAVTPAGAQPAESQAQALYDQGRALVAAGKTAEACAAFEQSQQLEPAVTTLFALATCRERLGQLATARKLFLRVEERTRSASDRTAAQLHGLARDRAAGLAPRLSKLTIHVPDRRKRDGLEIRRDQESVPAEEWNVALPVDGGTFTIAARAPGAKDWSTQVTLAPEADARTVDVPELQQAEPGPAAPPKAPAAEQPPGSSGRSSAGLPIAVGAGAVVLLGGALGLSLWGDATYDDAKAEMTDQARRDEFEASAERKRYAAQAVAVAGVGCAGVAVWLYLRGRNARSEPAAVRAGSLTLVPTASGIGVSGRF